MEFWKTLYTLATFQGFFVSLVLWIVKKGSKTANRFLSVLVFLLSLYLLDNLLGMHGFFLSHPHFLNIATPLWVLFAPLSYFYVLYQTNVKVELKWVHLLHLIPFAILLHKFAPYYFLSPDIKLQYYTGELIPSRSELARLIYVMLSATQITLYSGYILFRSLSKEMVANINSSQLSWLRIIFGTLLLFGLTAFGLQLNWLLYRDNFLPFNLIPLAAFSTIIYSIAYLAIVRPENIFWFGKLNRPKTNGAQSKQYAEQLVEFMEVDKPYLNSDLKYSDLAVLLGVSARNFTEIMSSVIGLSFNDFVNSYRIKEVKRRIANNDMQKFTLLAISLESGFNSKSSFNRIFKKHTGITPSEFVAKTTVKTHH